MGAFVDAYLPEGVLGLPCHSAPRTSTRIVVAASGDEARNRNWRHPLRRFMMPEAVCEHEDYEDLLTHWLVVGGPYSSFPFRDPWDFSSGKLISANVPPPLSPTDQPFSAIGDGFQTTFQMIKRRSVANINYDRPIYLPVLSTFLLALNGGSPASAPGGPYTFTVSRPGGEVQFDHPLSAGVVPTWGGLFDTEVRWEADDSLSAILHSLDTDGAAELDLVEVRRC